MYDPSEDCTAVLPGICYEDAIDCAFHFKIPTYPLILLITTPQHAYKIDMGIKG